MRSSIVQALEPSTVTLHAAECTSNYGYQRGMVHLPSRHYPSPLRTGRQSYSERRGELPGVPERGLGLSMFRTVGYLVDVAVRGAKVRPRLSRGSPLVDGTDELQALRLENPAGTLDVVHQKTGDRSPGEVGVLGIRGAEDLGLAAVRQPEEREFALLVFERESQGVPVEPHHLLVMLGAGADPHQALDNGVRSSLLTFT